MVTENSPVKPLLSDLVAISDNCGKISDRVLIIKALLNFPDTTDYENVSIEDLHHVIEVVNSQFHFLVALLEKQEKLTNNCLNLAGGVCDAK